jgi:uncharacterized protein YggU (UPF0235/DUF167 family)
MKLLYHDHIRYLGMRIAVRVKPGAYRDRLWRDDEGLVAHIRARPVDGEANAYLLRYLAGCLRVAPSLVRLVRGRTSTVKMIDVAAPEADLRPMLSALEPPPQAGLFDEQ